VSVYSYLADQVRRGLARKMVFVDGRAPMIFVECKLGDQAPNKGLRYLKVRFPACPAWQVSATGKKDYLSAQGIRVATALALLRELV
jgi:hypothetical protein